MSRRVWQGQEVIERRFVKSLQRHCQSKNTEQQNKENPLNKQLRVGRQKHDFSKRTK